MDVTKPTPIKFGDQIYQAVNLRVRKTPVGDLVRFEIHPAHRAQWCDGTYQIPATAVDPAVYDKARENDCELDSRTTTSAKSAAK